MQRNEIYQFDEKIYRILEIKDGQVLIIDCKKFSMPKWVEQSLFCEFEEISQEQFYQNIGFEIVNEDEIEPERKATMYQRYTIISAAIACVANTHIRAELIQRAAEKYGISDQIIRDYLCKYLAIQHIQALLPKKRSHKRGLTSDEENMRWALNKFFYTTKKNSLKTAYTFLLKEKYCDGQGQLLDTYPTFCQFRYFYRKTKSLQNYYISRNGLSDYQRNERPCLGDRVQEYAPAVGMGMVDGTVCDIYLVNECGLLIGRPIFVACIDAFSSLCLGFYLGWEGGIYSLRELMLNILADKVSFCKDNGILIAEDDWPTIPNRVPSEIVSDQGSEYVGNTFEQLTDLGLVITNLQPFRPDLKGPVEKFFDIIQSLYKPYLKGRGVIEPDYQQRGAHDYRLDACIDLKTFKQIIIRCIIYYNSRRVIENYPFSDSMITEKVRPYSNAIFQFGLQQMGANLIKCKPEDMVLCLLPRIQGKFGRNGLIVNKMRYKNDGKADQYLEKKTVTVAYDPDDTNYVWLYEKGVYTRFELIERRFENRSVEDAHQMMEKKRKLIDMELKSQMQADIDLANHIQTLANGRNAVHKVNTKNVRENRRKEQITTHKSQVKGVRLDD